MGRLAAAVAYLNQLRSAGFTLPSSRASPAVLAFADDIKSYVQDSAVDGVAIKAALKLAKQAGLPAQSAPKTKLLHICGQ